MDKLIYLRFSVLKLSNLGMCKTSLDKLQPNFGRKIIHLHNMGFESFVVSTETQNIICELKIFEDIFDFSNLDENHETFSVKSKKIVGEYKLEVPKNICID